MYNNVSKLLAELFLSCLRYLMLRLVMKLAHKDCEQYACVLFSHTVLCSEARMEKMIQVQGLQITGNLVAWTLTTV